VVVYAVQARVRFPDLKAWHRIRLENEFRAGRGDVRSFEDYLRLEDKLFAEVKSRVLDDPASADPYAIGRYHAGSIPAQLALETPHNRSYELKVDNPRGAVLLVHGLSDSPYSMRALAKTFFEQGYDVVVLRLPGHGTTPSMLRDVTWQDWYAAVTLAAKYAASRAGPGRPFLAAGHSTGAALLSLYSVRALGDTTLPKPARLYLMSPAIGISKAAVLTNVISALAFVPAFEKSAWVDVLPEYDPYKYNSFPVNAGNQIYRLTRQLQDELAAAQEAGRLNAYPRTIIFQSLVDATVTASAVVRGLLGVLPAAGHELVLFDVNRFETIQGLLGPGPLEFLDRLRSAPDQPFRITVIGNRSESSLEIAAYTREPGSRDVTAVDLPLAWPAGVFSLGHVAIPIPVDDPVYGLSPDPAAKPRFALGAFPARGENGALTVPLDMLARLRSNPFFDVIRQKVAESCSKDAAVGSGAGTNM
jgi:alpha-beta hydrolase superfamily lysophospholipase